MSNHREVHVVMAGLVALYRHHNGEEHVKDTAIFVRDPEHQLQGRVYFFDKETPQQRTIPLANHRVSFSWLNSRTGHCVQCEDGYSHKELTVDPPTNEDEAEELRVPNIRDATDWSADVAIDKRCVDEKPIRRVVAAQALLDCGVLCSGHLVSIGSLVPMLYFRGEGYFQTCADVMVLKMVAPDSADKLIITTELLPNFGSPVTDDFDLNDKAPLTVSLTNQSKPVSDAPPLAGHFRAYRKLLCELGGIGYPYRPRVYVPRLRGGDKDSKFATVQPGMDFDGIEGVTPPSVQNRAMCPFAEIPDAENPDAK